MTNSREVLCEALAQIAYLTHLDRCVRGCRPAVDTWMWAQTALEKSK